MSKSPGEADALVRCVWCGAGPLYQRYHDT